MIENSSCVSILASFVSDVLSAIIVAILTIIITRISNKRNLWLEARSELIAYNNRQRELIINLANNPSCYNNQHFIAYFSNELHYIQNLCGKINSRRYHNILNNVWAYISSGYKEFLLNQDNETVLNLEGKSNPDKYGAFVVALDALFLKANEIILEIK